MIPSVTLRLLWHVCAHWLVGMLSCLPLTDMTEQAEKAMYQWQYSNGTELHVSSQWLHGLLTVLTVHTGCVLVYSFIPTYYDVTL